MKNSKADKQALDCRQWWTLHPGAEMCGAEHHKTRARKAAPKLYYRWVCVDCRRPKMYYGILTESNVVPKCPNDKGEHPHFVAGEL